MTKFETAALKTLAYADIFNQALTHDELIKFLIGHKTNRKELSQLNSKYCQSINDIWVLTGREDLLTLKKSQILNTKYKIQQAKKYEMAFRLLPWIQLVAITGSVAGGTPQPDDDIDVLIITQPHRLWLTRFILNVLLNSIGKRRKPHHQPHQVNNKFCLNFWLTTAELSEKNHDLYTANELSRVIPILDRGNTHERYLQANSWIIEYLPNIKISNGKLPQLPAPKSQFLSQIDHLAEKVQKRLMRKPTIETIETGRLAFHPRDYRNQILQMYQDKLHALAIQSDTK